eukprot:2471920-Rhodomonas_salina.1
MLLEYCASAKWYGTMPRVWSRVVLVPGHSRRSVTSCYGSDARVSCYGMVLGNAARYCAMEQHCSTRLRYAARGSTGPLEEISHVMPPMLPLHAQQHALGQYRTSRSTIP